MSAPRLYSGVVLNQNGGQGTSNGSVAISNSFYYQTFLLPSSYARGEDDDLTIPALTGIQVFVQIVAGSASTASLNWTLDHDVVGTGWVTLASGTATGASSDGSEVWFNIFFPDSVNILTDWLTDRFRFGIAAEQGISQVWYSSPNPLALTFDKAFQSDGTTALQPAGSDVSLMFRVLAATADQGTDFLGDQYRSVMIKDNAANVGTSSTAVHNKFWLSKPNPSRFAVESLYFDMGGSTVVDRVMVDPLTPGIYYHLYYSNDDLPGSDAASWDALMWTPVAHSFQANNKQTLALPAPITAKFIKLEFSHLQARYYAPGNFQRPILFKKHPKWVLDYFMGIRPAQLTGDPLVGRTTVVENDSFSLFYNYYDGDILSEPTSPFTTATPATDATGVDFDTLLKIRTTFQPYTSKPGLQGKPDSLLGAMAQQLNDTDTNYSTEIITRQQASTDLVSSLDRDSLLIEKSFPVMFFYIPCRHGYRVAMAEFANDRAYFAGVKQVAFFRDRYTAKADQALYIESAGDTPNVERLDFDTQNGIWVTYAS